MKMTLTIELDDTRLYYLLFGHALSYSWWGSFRGRLFKEEPDGKHGVKYTAIPDAVCRVSYDDPTKGEDGEHTGRKVVNFADIEKGLLIMSEKYPSAWADFMAENDDVCTCDLAWQCIVFGEEVFA